MIIRYLANILSFTRILAAFFVFFITPLSWGFYLVYSYCGLTDVLDGIVARSMQTESHMGARLDSIADMVLFIVVFYRLGPVLWLSASRWIWIFAIIIGLIRITAYIVGAMRFRQFAALHLISNKATGLVLFFVPYLFLIIDMNIALIGLCIIATLSSLEELLCEIKAKQYNPNIRSYFDL
ncbi:MAG: CDP-alcohol phosphatidyltransferase family protein [Vallitaleaceae bacterium]|nr:CDP-alcohol phosphatidyltransferase family protein [Vallitaleaceae bacterium]